MAPDLAGHLQSRNRLKSERPSVPVLVSFTYVGRLLLLFSAISCRERSGLDEMGGLDVDLRVHGRGKYDGEGLGAADTTKDDGKVLPMGPSLPVVATRGRSAAWSQPARVLGRCRAPPVHAEMAPRAREPLPS